MAGNDPPNGRGTMKTWLIYLRIALLAGGGWSAGTVRAQDREELPPPSPTSPPSVVYEGTPLAEPYSPTAPATHPSGWVALPGDLGHPPKHNHCLAGWVRAVGCWAHHNSYTCGSLESECTFIFGSCRAFFGEPCLRTPPPMLVPQGYEPPPAGGCSRCGP